jgi:hypothetical protein
MTQNPERLTSLFKLPAQLRIARDFLRQKLTALPDGGGEALVALDAVGEDAQALAAWCADWLSGEQIRGLQKALRLAANQQRVYKRTVMLSPRAHLLVKTLSEREGLKMSDVIELHLHGVLYDRFGLAIRTLVDEHSGLIEHEIVAHGADELPLL